MISKPYTLSDFEIAELISIGDEPAFSLIYTRYRDKLYGVGYNKFAAR